jgi:hypothetical protein
MFCATILGTTHTWLTLPILHLGLSWTKLDYAKNMCNHTTDPLPRVKLNSAGSEKLKNKLYHV